MLTAPVACSCRPRELLGRRVGRPRRDARRRCHRSAMPTASHGTSSRIVATAFTDGSIVRRSRDSTNSGSVCVRPRREVRDQHLVEGDRERDHHRAEDRRARSAGSVIRRSTICGVAPRSRAACSTVEVVVPQPRADDQDHERRRDDHVPGHDRAHRRVDRERLHRRHQRDPDEQRRQHHGQPRPALEPAELSREGRRAIAKAAVVPTTHRRRRAVARAAMRARSQSRAERLVPEDQPEPPEREAVRRPAQVRTAVERVQRRTTTSGR